MTLNQNIYPKDGYWFQERDGAKMAGDSWAGVIARVAAYRKRAGYPAGNPQEEVTAQACQRNPIICSQGDANPLKSAPLKTRVLAWLLHMRGRKAELRFVQGPEVSPRAEICARCPLNQGIPDGCASCMAAVRELRQAIIGGRKADARLKVCGLLGEDLQTSVHLDEPVFEHTGLPKGCWRKKEL